MGGDLLPPDALGLVLGDAPRIAANISQRTANEWAAEHQPAEPITLTSGLVLRPGDTLVLAFKEPLDDEAYRKLVRRLDEALPGVEHVVVLENSVGMAVYRPEA